MTQPRLNARSRARIFADKVMEYMAQKREFDFILLKMAAGLDNYAGCYLQNMELRGPEIELLRVIHKTAESMDAQLVCFHQDGLTVEFWDNERRGSLEW